MIVRFTAKHWSSSSHQSLVCVTRFDTRSDRRHSEKMDKKSPGKIIKLEETVINRIAAGEVIQRPANALKEMLENSLDAGSTGIQVVVKSGGMKLLQIQDDGSGIRKEDLPIVCERFTTSKLEKFEDLQSIGTYGFRGEALASISHVAHLTIVTKTADSQCAFRAEYSDGKLKEYPSDQNVQNPRPIAGKQGTTIIVEDLFYNMDTRRRALKSVHDEHNKIVEVVTKYAIHNAGVGFSLKKFGETMTEVRTLTKSSVLDNIKTLYGAAISRELLELSCDDKSAGFKLSGYISNVNYSTKKLMFLLFINHRLVDSSALKKSIEAVYYNYLPKGSHPFVYLSIQLDPKNVDVNVHPTKHEVHFLHEDMIVTAITSAAENILVGSNQSRTFLVQSLLPGASANASLSTSGNANKSSAQKEKDTSLPQSPSAPAPKHLVRTDPKAQKLDKFLSSTPNPDVSRMQSFQDSPSRIDLGDTASGNITNNENNTTVRSATAAVIPEGGATVTNRNTPPPSKRCNRELRLRSVKMMKEAIIKDTHEQLLHAFRKHTFVGCVDRTLALFQHELNLYLCNTFRLSAELFYQKLVDGFGNFGRILIEEPITIRDLVQIALEAGKVDDIGSRSNEDVANEVHDILMKRRKMLDDYFALGFDDEGRLTSLPLIIDNYYPNMNYMPTYVVNLAKKVVWTEEKACFETFCQATSIFYAIQPGKDSDNEELTLNGKSWKWTIEHIIYPEIKKSLHPPKNFAEDSTVVLLTSLPELYKVFERC